jgi:trimeric autotransporter adhesin
MPDRDPQGETLSADKPIPPGKPRLRAVGSDDDALTAAVAARQLAEDVSAAAGRARADSVAELAADVRSLRAEQSAERARADEFQHEARDTAEALAAAEHRGREAAAAKRMADRKAEETEMRIADLESDRSGLRARIAQIESERTQVIEAAVTEQTAQVERRANEQADQKIAAAREELRERAQAKLRTAAAKIKQQAESRARELALKAARDAQEKALQMAEVKVKAADERAAQAIAEAERKIEAAKADANRREAPPRRGRGKGPRGGGRSAPQGARDELAAYFGSVGSMIR